MSKKSAPTKKGAPKKTANYSPLYWRLNEEIGPRNISELAKKLDISESAIRQWLSGYSQPALKFIVPVAEFLGVSCDYLLCKTDTRSPDANLQAAVDFTGLSEQAIKFLNEQSIHMKRDEINKGYDFSQLPEDDEESDEFWDDYSERETISSYAHKAKRLLELINAFICYDDLNSISLHAQQAALIASIQIAHLKKATAGLETLKAIIQSGGEITEEQIDSINRYCKLRDNGDNTLAVLHDHYDPSQEDEILLNEYKSQRMFARFLEMFSGFHMQTFEEKKRRMWQLRDECGKKELELRIKHGETNT
jgi:transcriptional regulator with XRE-family HTH domain